MTAQTAFPHTGICANCGRARDDLFWHTQDRAYYCADTFRCEARLEIQEARAAAVRPPEEQRQRQ